MKSIKGVAQFEPMSRFEIWWDDVIITKVIRLGRRISDRVTGRQWKKIGVSVDIQDPIGNIARERRISRRRAGKIFNQEIEKMARSVRTRIAALTW